MAGKMAYSLDLREAALNFIPSGKTQQRWKFCFSVFLIPDSFDGSSVRLRKAPILQNLRK